MTTPLLRCAIYTRVSSDSNLEQDFNSLDAQRESAEAYIKSQAHEGWRLVRERFDDGGFSGGSIERPALRNLLARIRERRIDVIVVYKVDRLTRSLADFAKLVELFDEHKVCFVSVTQAFNTTSSMGRLTLNVLLSFAQFEREVTGERIRDKIAASKKKGIWMGGELPFGYGVKDRKLFVIEDEAAIVRLMFDLYLEHKTIRAVQRELRDRQIRTRLRSTATGGTRGGICFTNGPICYMLRNRHYIGEINHKKNSWPGEHQAIIEVEKFDRVQAMLSEKRASSAATNHKSHALLLGKLFNDRGEKLTPTYAVKQGVRYRYYTSTSAIQSRKGHATPTDRLPAPAIESAVVQALRQAIAQEAGRGWVRSTERNRDASAEREPIRENAARKADDRWSGGVHRRGDEPVPNTEREFESARSNLNLATLADPTEARALIEGRLERVAVRADSLELIWRRIGVSDEQSTKTLTIPWIKPLFKVKRSVLEPLSASGRSQPLLSDECNRLIRSIALARSWVDELIAGSVADLVALATRERRTERSIRMTLSLAFLDPRLIEEAVNGRMPQGYGVSRLSELPARFDDQWRALGLKRNSA